MARKLSFGKILRDARHKKHIDITTAAARLRIRTDILQAIEDEDFSRMPPRGYTRNMIGAYARLLGLNGSDITRLYLDEAYAIEVGKARNDTVRSGGDERSRSSRYQSAEREGRRAERRADTQARPIRHGSNGRAMYDDRDDRGRTYATDRVHPSQHAPVPTTQYTNFYAGPSTNRLSGRMPFIIAGIIVIIAIIVFLVFLLRPQPQAQELPNVPIAGVTDTSDEESNEAPEPVPPTQATFTYEVASGQSAYIEIYVDGETTPVEAGLINGPDSGTYDVTGSLQFITAAPAAVTLKVDGETVKMTDENSDGVYEYTVDFASVLNQWLEDHGKTSSSSADSGDSDEDANSGDATSGDSDSSDSSSSRSSSSRNSSSSSSSGSSTSSSSRSSSSGSN